MRKLAVVALLLCGCSPLAPGAQVPTAPTATGPVATAAIATNPLPSGLMLELAGRFLGCAKPLNARVATLTDERDRGGTSPELQSIARRLASAYRTYIECLLSIPWPQSLRPEIEAVVAAHAAAQEAELGLAATPDALEYVRLAPIAEEKSVQAIDSTDRLRRALGLPRTPAQYRVGSGPRERPRR